MNSKLNYAVDEIINLLIAQVDLKSILALLLHYIKLYQEKLLIALESKFIW